MEGYGNHANEPSSISLDQVTFPDLFTAGDGSAQDQGGVTTTRTLSQPYAILGSVALSDTFTVTATDNVANQAVSQAVLVLQDTVPPTPTLTIPDVVPPIFEVKWGGIDLANNAGAVGSGIRSYNVQYRVGLTGTWFSLMTDTTELQYPRSFVGTPGEVYYFQLQATDNVSNTLSILDFGLPILDWEVTIQNPKSKISCRSPKRGTSRMGRSGGPMGRHRRILALQVNVTNAALV